FAAERFALIGDAAVGMHPVTAHGFNFGLASQHVLAKEIKAALARGEDFAAEAALSRYERAHRLATFALFHATNGIADLYSSESLPARLARQAGLRAANLLPPFKSFVVNRLTARAT
ncbi:MAG: 2-octaprenyl-6-methoxyphenyl hydroxylase, partial [Rhizobiaceae bacterium]